MKHVYSECYNVDQVWRDIQQKFLMWRHIESNNWPTFISKKLSDDISVDRTSDVHAYIRQPARRSMRHCMQTVYWEVVCLSFSRGSVDGKPAIFQEWSGLYFLCPTTRTRDAAVRMLKVALTRAKVRWNAYLIQLLNLSPELHVVFNQSYHQWTNENASDLSSSADCCVLGSY